MKSYLLILLISLFLSACGGGEGNGANNTLQDVRINYSFAGATVSIAKGQKLAVTLHGNGSTGYNWDVVSNSELFLKQGETRYVPDNLTPSIVGGGGNYTFIFEAIAQGETPLKLINHRSWDTAGEALDTFEVKVQIGG